MGETPGMKMADHSAPCWRRRVKAKTSLRPGGESSEAAAPGRSSEETRRTTLSRRPHTAGPQPCGPRLSGRPRQVAAALQPHRAPGRGTGKSGAPLSLRAEQADRWELQDPDPGRSQNSSATRSGSGERADVVRR